MSSHDSCFKGNEVLKSIYLVLYIDDRLLISSSISNILESKKILSKEFNMKDLSDFTKLLGMSIIKDRKNDSLALSQRDFLKKLVEKFAMRNVKPVTQPLANHFSLFTSQCPTSTSAKQSMKDVPYSSAIGLVMYTMMCSRPNIAHDISVLSKYMSNHDKDLLRYLKDTTDVGLMYYKRVSSVLVKGYVDSNYGGDKD